LKSRTPLLVSGTIFLLIGVVLFGLGTSLINLPSNTLFSGSSFDLTFTPISASVTAGESVEF